MPDPSLAALNLQGAIPRPAVNPALRHHIAPREWGVKPGTDFWFVPSGALVSGGGTGNTLADHGWTTTSLVETAGAGGDFGSQADPGAPPHLLTNASADLLKSPAVFGDYAHMHAASRFLGYLPTKLIAEFWGAMTVHSADEPRSGWGFVEDGGVSSAEADQLGWISSDGANFQIGANAATPVNGAADDALWHLFRIELDKRTGLITWAIDSVRQAMATSLAITADEFPVAFGFHALTTNRPGLGLTHIWYE